MPCIHAVLVWLFAGLVVMRRADAAACLLDRVAHPCSDLCAGLIGGLGLTPSANVGECCQPGQSCRRAQAHTHPSCMMCVCEAAVTAGRKMLLAAGPLLCLCRNRTITSIQHLAFVSHRCWLACSNGACSICLPATECCGDVMHHSVQKQTAVVRYMQALTVWR